MIFEAAYREATRLRLRIDGAFPRFCDAIPFGAPALRERKECRG